MKTTVTMANVPELTVRGSVVRKVLAPPAKRPFPGKAVGGIYVYPISIATGGSEFAEFQYPFEHAILIRFRQVIEERQADQSLTQILGYWEIPGYVTVTSPHFR
jgi:hypothetical protein